MKKNIIVIAMVMLFPLFSYSQFPPRIVLSGGNGTSDGEQVNRDYVFKAFVIPAINPSCSKIVKFEVRDKNSTSVHQRFGDELVLVWKSSYSGTTQFIEATSSCGSRSVIRLKLHD